MTEIGKEYGAALFMLACEADARQAYSDGIRVIETAFSEHPDFLELLASPAIPPHERVQSAAVVFENKIPTEVLSFLQLLCEKGRISCFGQAAEEFRALCRAADRVAVATVTSAVPLTAEEKEKLLSKLAQLNGGSVEATYAVDPALLGGVIVEMDGKVLDGSLRHRLLEIKEVMKQ